MDSLIAFGRPMADVRRKSAADELVASMAEKALVKCAANHDPAARDRMGRA